MSVEFKKVDGKLMYREQPAFAYEVTKDHNFPWREVPEVKEEKKSLAEELCDEYMYRTNGINKTIKIFEKIAEKAKSVILSEDKHIYLGKKLQQDFPHYPIHWTEYAKEVLRYLREDC